MSKSRRERLGIIILFSITFAAASLLFSLLSWGRAGPEPRPEMLPYLSGGLLDLVEHAVLGSIAALPTRRKLAIIICALGAVLIDVDHIGFVLGLPMQGRPSHGVTFAAVVFLIAFLLARKGILGRQIQPLVLGSLAFASVMAHLAWDAIDGGANFPLCMPFSSRLMFVSPFGGVLLELGAAVLVWAATMRRDHSADVKKKLP
jgi:hypothetical protein